MATSTTSTTRYRRVSQTDNDNEQEQQDKKRQGERVELITAKIHALIWIVVSIFLAKFTDLLDLLFSDRINRVALNISIVLFSIVIGIFFYLSFWLPVVMKENLPWHLASPNMIPISTVCGVASYISTMVAFWPVWGFLSPLFITLFTLGLIFSAHFIPWPFGTSE